MRSLLDLPAVRERLHLMSVNDYHRAGETGVLSEAVELMHGIVFDKPPKSPLHELVAGKLMDILVAQVPKEYVVRRESPLTLHSSHARPGWRSGARAAPGV